MDNTQGAVGPSQLVSNFFIGRPLGQACAAPPDRCEDRIDIGRLALCGEYPSVVPC